MVLSPANASAALRDAQQVEHASARLRGYQSASPHLIIWGLIWATGYLVSYLKPEWSGLVWLGLVPLGIVGDILAAQADGRKGDTGMEIAVLAAIFFVLIGGTIAIMQPHEPAQIGAFIPLLVAAAYCIMGVMGVTRMYYIGAALAALTLGGFLLLGNLFLPWMAVVGGGGLILGGMWLRRV